MSRVWCDCCFAEGGTRSRRWIHDPDRNFDLCPSCRDAETTGFPCRPFVGETIVTTRASLAGVGCCRRSWDPPGVRERELIHAARR